MLTFFNNYFIYHFIHFTRPRLCQRHVERWHTGKETAVLLRQHKNQERVQFKHLSVCLPDGPAAALQSPAAPSMLILLKQSNPNPYDAIWCECEQWNYYCSFSCKYVLPICLIMPKFGPLLSVSVILLNVCKTMFLRNSRIWLKFLINCFTSLELFLYINHVFVLQIVNLYNVLLQ